MSATRKQVPGLRERHTRSCQSNDGGRCTCTPSVEAFAYSKDDGKKIRRTFAGTGARSAAKAWRADAQSQINRGTLRAQPSTTVREAADEWLAGARSGVIRNRSGDRYKPSAVRAYEQALRLRILPDVGALRVGELRRVQLQDLVERWIAGGLDPSTVRNSLMPLRAIYRRAVSRGDLTVNPLSGIELPAVRGRRDRIASPSEAAALVAAVPEGDRALWAAAFYAGLRRGELMALRWEDVDLPAGLIHVCRSWDVQEGEVAPKSRSGHRTIGITPDLLKDPLLKHRMRSGRREGLVFGRTGSRPLCPSSLRGRAATAWKNEKLSPIGLHEARHTFASIMIAAGVNAKTLSYLMGHASITITLDRYGHMFPGTIEEAARLQTDYLARAALAP